MTTEIFALCKSADSHDGRSLTVQGTIDLLRVDKLPIHIAQLHAAYRIRFTQEDNGLRTITFSIHKPNGDLAIEAISIQAAIRFVVPETSGTWNQVVTIQNLSIQAYGTYTAKLTIDKKQAIAQIPLFVTNQADDPTHGVLGGYIVPSAR